MSFCQLLKDHFKVTIRFSELLSTLIETILLKWYVLVWLTVRPKLLQSRFSLLCVIGVVSNKWGMEFTLLRLRSLLLSLEIQVEHLHPPCAASEVIHPFSRVA